MERRDFVRRSGIAVALLTGCLGGGEEPGDDGGDGNTTENGADSEEGDAQNRTETDGEETGGGEQENEESGEETEDEEETEEESEGEQSGYEEAGYTRFMYDPEAAGVDADGYVFAYTAADASPGLTEGVTGASDSEVRIARTEVRNTDAESEEGQLPEEGTTETVTVRVYEQEGSLGELRSALTEPVDSHVGYNIYEPESGRSVFAVNEDKLTVIEGATSDRVRLVAETLEGETPSYAESSDDMRTLTDVAGEGDAVLIRGGLPEFDAPSVENALASAVSLSENDGSVSIRYAVVYPDEEGADGAVNPDSLEQEPPGGTEVPESELTPLFALAVTELSLSPDELEVSDQTVDGRVAVLEGSAEIDALFGGL